MSAHRFRRIDRRTAEQLLGGVPDRARAVGPDALSDLLAAASAPVREGELAGEQAALVAFRAARLADAPQPRRESMLKTTLAKVLTVKIAAAAVAVVAAGGVAVAAVTGSLPTQSRDSSTAPATTTVASTSGQASDSQSSGLSGKPVETGKNASENRTGNNPDGKNDGNANSGSPSPSLEGLCQAYTVGAGSEHGKALENPAFTVLITAAGGKDKVSAYCADLLGKQPGQQPAHPTGKPTTHPNGPDEAHPTGKPNGPPPTHPNR